MKKLIMLGSGGHAQALLSSKLVYHIDGLVSFEKKGRIKLIKLTKKGVDVADAIENIQKLVR